MFCSIALLAGILATSLALSPPYITPAPAPECRISDPATACPTYANCYGTSGCSTSGCGGGCAPTSSCTLGSLDRTCSDRGNSCIPFYTDCTTSGCFGACITTSAPTPSGYACKIDDLVRSCDQTPYSSCHGAIGCTTSGCDGTCTIRQQCQPTTADLSLSTGTPNAPCPSGQTCYVHSGTPFCYTTTSGGGGTMSCIQSDLSSSSQSTYLPTLPCTLGQRADNCPKCHACAAIPGGCFDSGCPGDCLPVPCATTSDEKTSTTTLTGYGGPSCTIGGTDCTNSCYLCVDVMNTCSTVGCIGECLAVPCLPPTEDMSDADITATATVFPDPAEPPLKTRTYDCLVSVTGGCGIGKQCEPYYGPCCDTLNCPGICADLSGSACSTEVHVTQTVTVFTTIA